MRLSRKGRMKRFAGVLLGALVATAATAGRFSEFETELRGVYATYRAALFTTNQNKPDEAAAAVAALSQGWTVLSQKWARAAPPQYADDPQFAPTLTLAAGEIADASRQIAAGDLGAAHITLEKIRDQLGALRARNHVAVFSDRMDEFHKEMEKTLGRLQADLTPAALADLRGEAAVLAYLADRIAAAPPPEAKSSAEFGPLVEGVAKAVRAVRQTAASGDAEATKRALHGLKKPYSILFLKFG